MNLEGRRSEARQIARRLMEAVDLGYELLASGIAAPWLLDLEVALEVLLWDLEWTLLDADEFDDIDGEAGVEEQFVAIWASYVDPRNPSFGLRPETARSALIDVLEGACLPGQSPGMAPWGLDISADADLLGIAQSLPQRREAHLERLRALPLSASEPSPIRKGLKPPPPGRSDAKRGL